MKVHLAADHAGFELKNHLLVFLQQQGFDVTDCGAFEYNPADDYPDIIAPVAAQVSSDPESRAIVLGGSGQGEAIVADKFDNVRATTYYGGPLEIVKLGREHNDANVLSLGARFVTQDEAEQACLLFLATEFDGGRHVERIEKISDYE